MALPTSGDAVQINTPSCPATVLSSAPDSDVKITGGNGNVWVLGNNFNAAASYLQNLAPSVISDFNLNRRYVSSGPNAGSIPIPDIGAAQPSFIRSILAQSRAANPNVVMDLVAGITDARFYRG